MFEFFKNFGKKELPTFVAESAPVEMVAVDEDSGTRPGF
jgi:hypothetical protein